MKTRRMAFRLARTRKGLSQLDLARKSGISLATLSRFEQGYGKLDTERVQRLSELLGIPPEDILMMEE